MPVDQLPNEGSAQARVTQPRGKTKARFGGSLWEWRLPTVVTRAGCVGRCPVCDFHSVNVCRMNGVCWSQGRQEG